MWEDSIQVIRKIIADGKMVKPVEGTAGFFIEKSTESIAVASRLFELTEEEARPSGCLILDTMPCKLRCL